MGRGKFKGKPTGRRQFSTPEEMGKHTNYPYLKPIVYSTLLSCLIVIEMVLFIVAFCGFL